VRFTWKPVAFARIARNTGANHVFPGRRPTSVARHDGGFDLVNHFVVVVWGAKAAESANYENIN
jgi:hypothetical protein